MRKKGIGMKNINMRNTINMTTKRINTTKKTNIRRRTINKKKKKRLLNKIKKKKQKLKREVLALIIGIKMPRRVRVQKHVLQEQLMTLIY